MERMVGRAEPKMAAFYGINRYADRDGEKVTLRRYELTGGTTLSDAVLAITDEEAEALIDPARFRRFADFRYGDAGFARLDRLLREAGK